MESADGPFGDAVGSVDGSCVGGFGEVLGDHIDGAFARGDEVPQGVFGVGEAACVAYYEERRVLVGGLALAMGGH